MRHRDFLLLFVGKNCGFTSLYAVLVAVAYQVYDITGDVLNLAWIGLATFAPGIGFALFTGYVVDQYDRRVVIALCSALIMIASLLLILRRKKPAANQGKSSDHLRLIRSSNS